MVLGWQGGLLGRNKDRGGRIVNAHVVADDGGAASEERGWWGCRHTLVEALPVVGARGVSESLLGEGA